MKLNFLDVEDSELAYKLMLSVACNSTQIMDPLQFRKISNAMIEIKPHESMTKWLNLLQCIRTSESHLEPLAIGRRWVAELPEDPAGITMLAVLLHTVGDSEYKKWYKKAKQITDSPVFLGLISHIRPPLDEAVTQLNKPLLRKLSFK
jgi:hypothetical protein